MPQRKICCLLATISVTAIFFFFYNQRKHSDGFWLSSKGTFTPFIDRCFVVLAGFHVTVLQYYFKDRQLLGIIPSSCSEGFPPPTASVQIHSILWKLCKDSHRWHTSCRASGFMTSLPNPSSSSVPSWLMPGSTSWCAFPRVDTRQLRSAAPHLYNSKRGGGGWGLRALLQCWKTHYVYFCQLLGSHGWGGPGSNWATSHEMKPRDQREDKQTRRLTQACVQIDSRRYPHVLCLLNAYTKTA